jgi:hypothetical protein
VHWASKRNLFTDLQLEDFDRSEMKHVDKNMHTTEQTVSIYVNHSASQND